MTTREEAAAKAQYEHGDLHERWAMAQPAMRQFHLRRMEAALEAADAHDVAHGVHRVSLEQLTKAIYEVDPLKFFGDEEPVPWEKLGPAWRALAKDKAKAVLAAAVGGDGE